MADTSRHSILSCFVIDSPVMVFTTSAINLMQHYKYIMLFVLLAVNTRQ